MLPRSLRELAESAVLALLLFLGLQVSLQNFRVEGHSMEPTLHQGEYVMVSKLSYRLEALEALPLLGEWFRPPRRGDVVVFRFPQDPSRDFVKRIVGLPGEVVDVRDGRVYINGEPLEEPWLPPGTQVERCYVCPLTVPADHYFVMGDNRPGSNDSRHWGPVPRRLLVGRVFLVYWPPGHARAVPGSPSHAGR